MNQLTGRQVYVAPDTNRRLIHLLLKKNAQENERILGKQKEWVLEHEDLYEEIRLDTEELAIWLMKRVAEFTKFRIRNEEGKAATKTRKKVLKVTEQDLNNAYDAVQMERQKY